MTRGSGDRGAPGTVRSRAEQSLRRAHRSLRKEPMNRLAHRLAGSSRVPFAVRSRSLWRARQWTWVPRRPVTVREKIRWKMLKDRRPLLTTFADKVAVRDYVAGVVGQGYLTAGYAIVGDPDELDRDALPAEFVAKANHGSGASWIVSAWRGNSPVGPRRFD
jgi:TupA-like ATPgrasp